MRYLTRSILLLGLTLTVEAGEPFGEPLSELVPVRIGELTRTPEQFVDKKVKVTGLVDDVCPMKGCWVEILEQQSSTTLRFKVQDDVIVFPAEARGREIVAEGFFRRHEMDETRARRWLAHLAEEKGEEFDPESVSGPLTFYQIEGLGAEIASSPVELTTQGSEPDKESG